MRKLYVHVGPPKTGTSAVQFFFSQYTEDDVLYPRVGLWADGSHHNLAFNYFQDYRRPEVQKGDMREWLHLIGQAASSQTGNLLISSEALFGRNLNDFVRDLLSHLPEGDQWSAEIVFACRAHLERAASMYNQDVKDGVVMERAVPDAYLARTAPGLRYAPYLRKLKDSGLPVLAINYHPSHTFVPRFLALVGVRDAERAAIAQRNVSLSVKALVATLAANRVATSVSKRTGYFTAIRRMRRMYGPSQGIFSVQAIEQAEQHFRQDREVLANDFGVQLPVPDGDTEKSGQFFVCRRDLDEIAAAVSDLGDDGAAIVSAASEFLRE